MDNKEYETMKIENILERLSKSKFRTSFHLKNKDMDYIDKKGLDVINDHARDFIYKRLSPAIIPNDGNPDKKSSCLHCSACHCHMLQKMFI